MSDYSLGKDFHQLWSSCGQSILLYIAEFDFKLLTSHTQSSEPRRNVIESNPSLHRSATVIEQELLTYLAKDIKPTLTGRSFVEVTESEAASLRKIIHSLLFIHLNAIISTHAYLWIRVHDVSAMPNGMIEAVEPQGSKSAKRQRDGFSVIRPGLMQYDHRRVYVDFISKANVFVNDPEQRFQLNNPVVQVKRRPSTSKASNSIDRPARDASPRESKTSPPVEKKTNWRKQLKATLF